MRSSKNELAGRFQSIVEELAGVQPKKFKSKYYPSTAMPVRPHKKVRDFPARKKRPTTSARAKPNEESDGEPDHVPHMLFMNCTVNMAPSAGGKSETVPGTTQPYGEEIPEARRKKSYLKMIVALCYMQGIDLAARNATSCITKGTENVGMGLDPKTVREILEEAQNISQC